MQMAIEEDRANKRGQKIDENVKLKICDLGNGCWTYHQFSSKIQTRQYRSPEVLIGAKYNATADIWSLACMIFELATGDFLFEPRKGSNYGKNDEHIAQMMELLGRMPREVALSGIRSRRYFKKNGSLRKI
jgi:serine/threonine-protein kinase SRPK3